MPQMSSEKRYPALTAIQEIFKQPTGVPYCTGTVQLDAAHSLLFYRSNDRAKYIDFANPTKARLKSLTDACFPATFVRNKEEIVDESYCKAGEMYSVEFSTQFSPWDSGLFKTVIDTLFKANESVGDVTYELYKLNVYGPGSFCKSRVDTPLSDTMIGTLVVVLPLPHTGGSSIFRHRHTKYTFDTAEAVSGDGPHAAFAAFFSDVEHEVAEVTSGHRVTLTYHIYRTASGPSDIPSGVTLQNQNLSNLQAALASLLSSPKFLPDGGLLAFGLSHEYPFNPKHPKATKVSDIGKHLKGIDALVTQVCGALKLEVSLQASYSESSEFRDDAYGFLDEFLHFDSDEEFDEEGFFGYLRDGTDAIIGYDTLYDRPAPTGYYGHNIVGVVWVKPPNDHNTFKEPYTEKSEYRKPNMAWVYGKLCLVVRIKSTSERD